jgi:hypothetical protein
MESTQITEVKPELAITLSERHAAAVMQNVNTLTTQFKTWMEEDVDYTRKLFGQNNKPSLLDSGAHKLTNFFQAYPDSKIIKEVEEREPGHERIKYVVRADIIHISGTRIGSGVGSCTTDESKYQYRWLTEYKLKGLGYSDQEIQTLPSQERRGNNGNYRVYRIRNPEILDLDNTILKMATKRAEVDAALSLPGVSGVFTQDIEQYPDALGVNDAQTGKQAPKQKPRKTEKQAKDPTPQPDPDEETVIDMLAVNGLGVNGFTVIKYDGAIRVTPPRDITQTQWDSYNPILEMKRATWNHEYKHWEIPL